MGEVFSRPETNNQAVNSVAGVGNAIVFNAQETVDTGGGNILTEIIGGVRYIDKEISIPKYVRNMIYKESQANYRSPKVEQNISIAKPHRVKGQCKCLNSNGTPNTSAFIYDRKCMTCPSSRDVFYPKGATTSFNWGTRQPGYLANAGLDSPSFNNLEDAKTTCETTSACTGVTQGFVTTPSSGSNRYTVYTMRGGSTVLASLSGEHSWKKNIGPTTYVTTGKYGGDSAAGGKLFTDEPIPRAFADDYKSANPPNRFAPVSSTTDAAGLAGNDMINFLRNSIGQAAALLTYKLSQERPDTYYTLIGLERHLRSNIPSSTDNYGICVGPCDSEHTLHDPIQMFKNTTDSANPLYVLYGTTCYDNSMIRIDKPSIPAIYTPGRGEECPAISNVIYTKVSNYCVAQCPADQVDTGTGCRGASKPRDSVAPSYSCPSSLRRVDNVCVFPCGPGLEMKGEYCESIPAISAPNTGSGSGSIKCMKTSQGFSTKYQESSGSSLRVNKWLCDSEDDLNRLLVGYKPNTGTTYYVNQNDIVCVSDDSSTGMYYCQSVSDAVNGVETSQRDNYSQSCDNLVKAYYDLSGNLDILSNARTNAQNAKVQVANIKITLDGVYASLCGNSRDGSSAICTRLESQLNQLTQNINASDGATSNVLNPIQIAIASRDNLVAQMTKFHCEY